MKKIKVGILGATGTLGQNYIALLKNHPWFELSFLAASEKGTYPEKVSGRWTIPHLSPPQMSVYPCDDYNEALQHCSLVFSALPTEQAKILEPLYAKVGFPVISSASYHRLDDDIPLLIPDVNPSHLGLLELQRKKRGWSSGFIVTKPNCSLQSFVLPLTPLLATFGIERLFVTTLQAISGAGNHGLSSLSIHDNVIPYIAGEEEKVEVEPLKVWGVWNGKELSYEKIAISAHCNRVPVIDGHLTCVSVSFKKKPSVENILNAWSSYTSPVSLPSLPTHPLFYHAEIDRPQTRLDRDAGKGMGVTVGRLRSCPLLDYRFAALSHNVIRGGAGGGVAIAELLFKEGCLGNVM